MYLTMERKESASATNVGAFRVLSTGVPDSFTPPHDESTSRFSGAVAVVVYTQPHVIRAAGIPTQHGATPLQVSIQLLITKRLSRPLSAVVEVDGEGFLARAVDFSLYGAGESVTDALAALRREIESLYDDLQEDDNFSSEWLAAKALLSEIVVHD